MAKKKVVEPAQLKTATIKTAVRKTAKRPVPTIVPNSFELVATSVKILRRHWKIFGGMLLIYMVLNILFASGISSISSTVDSIKADLNNTSPHFHPLVSAAGGFFVLVSSSGSSSNATGGLLQTMLIILQSLVIIWALRHLLAGKHPHLRTAYYNAMTPLVPFLLILGVVFIQLLPISLGSAAVAAIASALGTINGVWSAVFTLLLLGFIAWSFYMLSASIFGLYIVTLPGMRPMNALRSARNLVRKRRFKVLRRVLFLPVFVVIIMALVTIPLIVYATFLVTPVFYLLSALSLIFVHTYLYSLYRGLLG